MGWEAVVVSAILFLASLYLKTKTCYSRRKAAAGFQFGVLMKAAQDSLRPTAEHRLTKIGVCVWAVLFVIAIMRTGLEYRSGYGKAIEDLKEDKKNLKTKLDQKPTVVTEQVALPPDPSMMKIGTVFSIMGDVRTTLRNRASVTFLITAPPENNWLKTDLEALIIESCRNPGGPQFICTLEQAQGDTIPRPQQQGITMHIREPLQPRLLDGVVQHPGPLVDTLPQVLSSWYTVRKNQNIPDAIVERFNSFFRDTTFVWIEIGPGLPWRANDVRVRDGVSQSDIDKLAGWDVPLRQRLKRAAMEVTEVEKLYPDPPKPIRRQDGTLMPTFAMSNGQMERYQAFQPEVVMVIRDTRRTGIDTENAESIARNASKKEDFVALEKLLIKFSGDSSLK